MMGDFLEVAALTDVGNVRQYNEDSVAVDLDNGLVALADGMGGHRAGEVASVMATDTILAASEACRTTLRHAAAAARPAACSRPKHKARQSRHP